MMEKQINRKIKMLASVCVLEIRVEWIRRLSYVCGCERDRERVHVSHIQTNIREK